MTSESAEFERLRQRAVAIGEGDETGAASELVSLLGSPSPRVRRAAASAMGKLAERHQGLHRQFATTLYLKALDETGDQVREYMLKALARCASAMTGTMVRGRRSAALCDIESASDIWPCALEGRRAAERFEVLPFDFTPLLSRASFSPLPFSLRDEGNSCIIRDNLSED